jgi:hypothetical protein
MCDYFLQRMEGDNRQAGDLTDVVRAGGVMQAGVAEDLSYAATAGWQLPAAAEPGAGIFPPPQQPSPSDGAGPSDDAFGDAFAGLSDAFGTAGDFRACPSGGAADFFDFEAPVGGRGGGGALVDTGGGGVVARGMQMPSPREIRPYPVMMAGGDAVKLGVPTMMPGLAAVGPPCAFDAVAGMQMPSLPHGAGIKRRFGTAIAARSKQFLIIVSCRNQTLP